MKALLLTFLFSTQKLHHTVDIGIIVLLLKRNMVLALQPALGRCVAIFQLSYYSSPRNSLSYPP